MSTETKLRCKRRVYTRDNFTCQECGYRPPEEYIPPEEWNGRGIIGTPKRKYVALGEPLDHLMHYSRVLTLDHVKELALGGTNTLENLQTLCDHCNVKKSVWLSRELNQQRLIRVGT
jgi:5-methylcytosine-specific restriction endonuclease McrA